ncbi:MAG: fatty acid CoA ligase family protein [Pirellulales bacterium]
MTDDGHASPRHLNVAKRLTDCAHRQPNAIAVIVPVRGGTGKSEYARHTFRQLDDDSSTIARGLIRLGITPGMRLALLVRPGFEFISLVFALLKSGAVQVLVDPGLGKRNALQCLAEMEPEGFIAIPPGQAARCLFRGQFPRARLNVTVGRRWFWPGPTLQDVRRAGQPAGELPATTADEPAAIIFTSGSTGPPKGVLYSHGNFDRQVTEIRDQYQIEPGTIDVACFPLFALFNCAMGATTVFPVMDASRPAAVDPRNIIKVVQDLGATQSFGSPAVWNKVGRYCQQHNISLPTLRRVLSAGAPVPTHVLERMSHCIAADGEVHTPYGATEALPVATISAREVIQQTAAKTQSGGGVCVGQRFAGIEWKVARIVDGPFESVDAIQELPRGEIGELLVRGPVVTRRYMARDEATAKAKVPDGDTFWHRMGDAGYLDEEDRFWFCGRVGHRVVTGEETLFTIPCEAIYNAHPDVNRSALVGIGQPGQATPVMILEPATGLWPPGAADRRNFIETARQLGKANPLTAGIEHFLLHRSFPVDVRHNAKIFREKLAVWAARRV